MTRSAKNSTRFRCCCLVAATRKGRGQFVLLAARSLPSALPPSWRGGHDLKFGAPKASTPRLITGVKRTHNQQFKEEIHMTKPQTPPKSNEDRAPFPPTKFYSTRKALENTVAGFRSARPARQPDSRKESK
jgi:hypothetical protein